VIGFLDTAPILVKVTWTANEVALLNGEPTAEGLRATTKISGGITRWFVPWAAIQYIKQDIPDDVPAPNPTVPAPTRPTGD
jgi:hypothetical protein